MPYELSWYVEERIVYGRIWGNINIDTVYSASDDLIKYLGLGKPLVHLFLDDSQVTAFPSNFYAVRGAATFLTHENLGWSVMVGETNFIRQFILPMVTSIARVRYRRYHTFDEGLAFLKEQDQSINWAEANQKVVVTG